jgi:hypothetical protein
MKANEVDCAAQHIGSSGLRPFAPDFERFRGCIDSLTRFFYRAARGGVYEFACSGVDYFEEVAALRSDPLSSDKHLCHDFSPMISRLVDFKFFKKLAYKTGKAREQWRLQSVRFIEYIDESQLRFFSAIDFHFPAVPVGYPVFSDAPPRIKIELYFAIPPFVFGSGQENFSNYSGLHLREQEKNH